MALLGEAFVARASVTQAYESHEGVTYIYIYIYMIEGPLGSICRLGFCSQYIYNLSNLNNLHNLISLNPAHLN